MAEYINREDIIKWIDDSLEMCGDRYSVDQENMMELFRTVVNDCLPFADVVEVVRCKDCKYNNHCMTQNFMEDCGVIPLDRNTFFCADGKR